MAIDSDRDYREYRGYRVGAPQKIHEAAQYEFCLRQSIKVMRTIYKMAGLCSVARHLHDIHVIHDNHDAITLH